MELRTAELAAAVGGRLEGPDVVVDGATQDSRAIAPGQLFVPIVAERDGHDFIAAALANGAAPTSPRGPSAGGTAIVVADTAAALQAAGRLARSRLPDRVIGVTGSVGKTTVKDLLAAVLSRAVGHRRPACGRSTTSSGVPLTLLNAPDGTEAVVVEMGARGVGHIADLCAIAAPTVGVVTRVAAVHTEVFGHIDEVARAKGELVEALPATAPPCSTPATSGWRPWRRAPSAAVLTYGDGRRGAWPRTSRSTTTCGPGSGWCRRGGRSRSSWPCAALHQVENALAAAAAALVVDVDLAGVAAGLATARRCRRGGWSWARRPTASACSTTPTTPTPRRWRRRSSRWRRCRPGDGSRCSA